MLSPRVKKIVIGVGILIVVVLAASLLGGKNNGEAPAGGLATSRVDGPIGISGADAVRNDEFLNTLSSVRGITIDTSIFQDPAFLFLKDHPVILGSDTIGRPNPFAPLGSDQPLENSSLPSPQGGTFGKTVAPGTTGIETLTPSKVTATSAEFSASVGFPEGTGPAVVIFEYGTTQATTTPTESLIIDNPGSISLRVNGLAPGTTYYLRAVLLYGTQTLRGALVSFATPAR